MRRATKSSICSTASRTIRRRGSRVVLPWAGLSDEAPSGASPASGAPTDVADQRRRSFVEINWDRRLCRQTLHGLPRQTARLDMSVLPAVYRRDGNPDGVGELLLSHVQASTQHGNVVRVPLGSALG